MPQGKLLRDLEEEKSVVIRFVVGYRSEAAHYPPHSCQRSWQCPPCIGACLKVCTSLSAYFLQTPPSAPACAADHTKEVVRFEVLKAFTERPACCCSEQKDDPDELRVQEEIKLYGDILRLDMVDTYADLSMKTLKMFSVLPAKFDADFYFKIDDDVAVNIDAMAAYLQAKRNQGNLYLVSPSGLGLCLEHQSVLAALAATQSYSRAQDWTVDFPCHIYFAMIWHAVGCRELQSIRELLRAHFHVVLR